MAVNSQIKDNYKKEKKNLCTFRLRVREVAIKILNRFKVLQVFFYFDEAYMHASYTYSNRERHSWFC